MSSGERLVELSGLFLKLGVIGFGGPAAHIAMLEDEVVQRRRWLSREHFLDLVGATNLIPGPNSTEMTMHVGFLRAGWPGLIVAGASFILPAVLLTGLLAWFYVRFGALPQVEPFLFGVKPAVLAIILTAVWRLGRAAARNARLLVIGGAVGLGVLLGLNEVLALLLGGVIGMLWLRQSAALLGLLAPGLGLSWPGGLLAAANEVSLWQLGGFFLLIGSVLYGSGYVLIAFLEGGLVQRFGWLTQQQLLDAIAIGQFTPGPVLSTATFIGYILAGWPGAIVSTIGIFLPSFLFVAALNPWIPRLRRSPCTGAFLDAVNISAVGLMAAVLIKLALVTLASWQAALIALVAGGAALRWRLNAGWLVLGGALAGWLLLLIRP